MPRRNHRPRPRARVAPLLPAERPSSPQQLAQRLVSRGLADAVILGEALPSYLRGHKE